MEPRRAPARCGFEIGTGGFNGNLVGYIYNIYILLLYIVLDNNRFIYIYIYYYILYLTIIDSYRYIYIMKLVTEENLPRFTPQGFAPFRPRTSVPASLGECSTI